MAAEILRLVPAPLLRRPVRIRGLMWRVVMALAPAALLGVTVYGLPAALMLGSVLLGAQLGEVLFWRMSGMRRRLGDGSAVLSGLLLSLTLPPGLAPGWAFLGGLLGVVVGKQIFGGLGRNPLNPALTGRLLLALLAPGPLTSGYMKPLGWSGSWLDGGTAGAPEPLGALRAINEVLRQTLAGQVPESLPLSLPPFSDRLHLIQQCQDLLSQLGPGQLIFREVPGLLGEVSLLVILPGLVYLFAARLTDWRIPAAGLLVLPLALLLAAGGPADQWFSLALILHGALLSLIFCVFAADPVTSPLGHLAKLVYGLFLALGVVLILRFSGQAGALLWMVLAANLATPWLDRLLLPGGPR